MNKIKLKSFYLDRYKSEYEGFKKDFNNDSKSRFINNIDVRLQNSMQEEDFSFPSAYVVLDNENPVAYIYVSSIIKDEVFLEISVLNKYRNMGYGSKILDEVCDYLFENHNIRCVKLDIDPSNKNSIAMAQNCYFEFDEEAYESQNYMGHMIFYKESNCYVDRRRK